MRPKVLAIDDDPEFVELITYNLQLLGCKVVGASNGLQALNLARTELPDVILLDLMLPDLDGMVVFQILRSQPSTRQIPVLILSALQESLVGKRRRRLRYEQYFQKPVDLRALGRSILSAARKHFTLIHGTSCENGDSLGFDVENADNKLRCSHKERP